MCDDSSPRLKAADLQKLAQQRLARLQAEGEELHPVVNTTRKLAANFWGSAWMKQLAHCESGGMCLAPGRTLLRQSGTEPVIRVMVEAETSELCEKYAAMIADVIKERGHCVE